MKNNRLFNALVIVAGSLLMTTITVLIILTVTRVFDKLPFLEFIFVGLSLIFTAFFAMTLFAFFSQYTVNKTIQIENEYILGRKSNFNNLYSFQRRVAFAIKRRHHDSQYVIAFSPSTLIVSQNVNRNIEMFALNNHIVDYLDQLVEQLGLHKNDFIFAFSRGTFLVYAFKQSEQDLQRFCEALGKEIYEFGAAECTHLWVQPFFGIAKVDANIAILQDVENALIARDYSEKNFESITFYQSSFRRSVTSDDIDELSKALENNEFVVYYQPKFDLLNKCFISSEALIRWNNEQHGLLSPTKFLGKAEAVGLIHEIDIFVLKRVCEDLNDLRRRGKRLLPVSVNFSLYEFYSDTFLDTLMGILEEFQIPPHLIEIEITEATSQANQFLSISIIKRIKDRGIRVLMDDFGIGYSNVGNLKKIPFDAVKIDKSFIDNITTDPKSREIVRFLIGLCKINEMEVIAEGVDSKEQVEILRKAKCDTIQGFYYSQALSKIDFEKFLADNPFEKKGAAN